MGLLDVFRPKTERKDALLVRATAVSTFAYGRPYLADWSFERAIKDGFDRVVWVFRCIDAIASNASGLELVMRDGHPIKGKPLTSHPNLAVLNNRANIFERSENFIYRLVSQYLLNKRGAFIEVKYNRKGQVGALYLLPPQWTNPIPDPNSFVAAYRVLVPGGLPFIDVPAYVPPGQPGEGKAQVLWIRKPHPMDPYSGITPLESAGLAIDIDYYARIFNRAFLQNDGRPGGILAVKGDMSDQDAEALRRKFSPGPSGAGRTAVIEADELSWIDTSATQRDSQYVESRKDTKEEILLAFGVPESIIGNASGRTFDNADAEKLIFWQETMVNHLRIIAGGLNQLNDDPVPFWTDDQGVSRPLLTTLSEPTGLWTAFDTSSVAVLQRDAQAQMASDLKLVQSFVMTPDEFRTRWPDYTGDPFDTPGSRALWGMSTYSALIPANAADAKVLAPAPPPAPLVVHAAPPADGSAAPPKPAEPGQPALPVGKPTPALPAPSAAPAAAEAAAKMLELKQYTGAGVMVALFLPAAEASLLAIPDGEDPADLHVTLAFFGNANQVDLDALRQVVSTFALTMPALEARVSGYGRFDQDAEHVVYASIDSPDLAEFRQRLIGALVAAGLEPSEQHGFSPHVTLQYLGADDPDPEMPPKLSFTFPAITVAAGADQRSYRLTGETKSLLRGETRRWLVGSLR